METKEILQEYAPSFVALDEAERKSQPAPWKMDNSGWIFHGEPAIKFEVQSREGAFHNADGKFVYEAKWCTRALLDAHAQALVKLEKAKEALRFYGDCGNFLFCENQFLEFNDAESTADITKTSVVGHQARAALAEIE